VSYEILLEKGSLILVMPRQAKETLHPLYKDAFQADDYVLIFQRDRRSRIIGFNLYDDRAWNVAFVKTKISKARATTTSQFLN
jgi:hypothetical protein